MKRKIYLKRVEGKDFSCFGCYFYKNNHKYFLDGSCYDRFECDNYHVFKLIKIEKELK